MKYRVWFIALVTALLSGCIGYQKSYARTETFDLSPPKTKADITRVFGKPDSISQTDSVETWTYKHRPISCGTVIFFIVPIPLGLPECNADSTVDFRDDMAIQSHRVSAGLDQHVYGNIGFMAQH